MSDNSHFTVTGQFFAAASFLFKLYGFWTIYYFSLEDHHHSNSIVRFSKIKLQATTENEHFESGTIVNNKIEQHSDDIASNQQTYRDTHVAICLSNNST